MHQRKNAEDLGYPYLSKQSSIRHGQIMAKFDFEWHLTF